MIDERTEELASLYVLGLLQGEELRAFEKSLSESAELRRAVDRLREASVSLSSLAPSRAPSPELRERILRVAAETPQVSASVRTRPNPTVQSSAKRVSWPAWLGWGIAAALALLLWQQSSRLKTTEADRLALDSSTDEAHRKLGEMERSYQTLLESSNARIAELQRASNIADLKIAKLALLNGNSPAAVAIAVWNPTANAGVLSVENLPELGAAEDYQLWVIDPQQTDPVSAGVIQMNTDGSARVTFTPAQRVNAAAQFAISRERKGGVDKVQGPIIAAGSL